jgi:phosphate transport system substrate-binding protein
MHKTPKNAASSKQALDFFTWAYANGDEAATQLGYVPLPDSLVEQIKAYWASSAK